MEEHHLKALRILNENPMLSQRVIARKLTLSLGKSNYILKALIKSGHVKMKRFKNARKRLSYMYVLTPAGIRKRMDLTVKLIKMKSEEYNRLESEIRQLREEMETFRNPVRHKNAAG
jgi:EPS-associated MarR family transcriptional regulator